MPEMAFYLGIDGGGTKTTCVIGDEHSVLGTGTAGGSNIVRVGETTARTNLHAAIRQTCAAAHVPPADIAATCIGVAGVSAKDVTNKVRDIIAEIVTGEVRVVGDMEIAMQAAHGDGPGVIVIAGTGSMAFARDDSGRTVRAGGWGYAVSDEGSAHWIGRQAVVRALRDSDSDKPSSLLKLIQLEWNAERMEDVVKTANSNPPPNFARLFPILAKSAGESDPAVCDLFRDAALELAGLAERVIRRLWGEDAMRNVPVAMIGGVFRSSDLVRQTFARAMREKNMGLILSDVVDPAMGALELARRAVHAAGNTGG